MRGELVHPRGFALQTQFNPHESEDPLIYISDCALNVIQVYNAVNGNYKEKT